MKAGIILFFSYLQTVFIYYYIVVRIPDGLALTNDHCSWSNIRGGRRR
jgi:hypothetical protein